MTLEQKIEKAAELGKAAFERGAMAVSAILGIWAAAFVLIAIIRASP